MRRIDAASAEPNPTLDEALCCRCGGANVIGWSAASPLWNAVMRGGTIDGYPEPFHGIICPTCFCILAQEAGVAWQFRLAAADVHVELETVTPTGRVWDNETWLWRDGPQEVVVGGRMSVISDKARRIDR